jgi:hypothetical protein
MSSQTTHHRTANRGRRMVGGPLAAGARPGGTTIADTPYPGSVPASGYYDLAVRHAREKWAEIRWSLFVFPDITEVATTDDPGVVRIFYEGRRPYPNVWRVHLLQTGFDVPAPDTGRPSDGWSPPTPPRSVDRAHAAAGAGALGEIHQSGSNGHRLK